MAYASCRFPCDAMNAAVSSNMDTLYNKYMKHAAKLKVGLSYHPLTLIGRSRVMNMIMQEVGHVATESDVHTFPTHIRISTRISPRKDPLHYPHKVSCYSLTCFGSHVNMCFNICTVSRYPPQSCPLAWTLPCDMPCRPCDVSCDNTATPTLRMTSGT